MGKRFDTAAYQNRSVEDLQTYELQLPSGFVFTVRRPNIKSYAVSGRLPENLLQKMIEAEKRGATAAVSDDLSTDETVELLAFQALLVKKACVVPRIVDDPQTPEEIRFEDLDDDDFLYLSQWCNTGSVEGENFDKFRKKS